MSDRKFTLHLDVEALYVRLDKQRRERNLSWRGVAAETDLGNNVFHRLAHGRGCPSADALIELMDWLREDDITVFIAARRKDDTEAAP